MSDGFSDLNFDEKRKKEYRNFLEKVVNYLSSNNANNKESLNQIIQSARDIDSIGSLGSFKTHLSVNLQENLEIIKRGDPEKIDNYISKLCYNILPKKELENFFLKLREKCK